MFCRNDGETVFMHLCPCTVRTSSAISVTNLEPYLLLKRDLSNSSIDAGRPLSFLCHAESIKICLYAVFQRASFFQQKFSHFIVRARREAPSENTSHSRIWVMHAVTEAMVNLRGWGCKYTQRPRQNRDIFFLYWWGV